MNRSDPSRVDRPVEQSRQDDLTTDDMARAGRQRAQVPDNVTALRGGSDQTVPADVRPGERAAEIMPLFNATDATSFRSRWDAVQAEFVDDPRHAVEDADHLVAEAIQRLAQTFADERAQLEHQWTRGNDHSTEDLRLALQRYRSFFHRLLATGSSST